MIERAVFTRLFREMDVVQPVLVLDRKGYELSNRSCVLSADNDVEEESSFASVWLPRESSRPVVVEDDLRSFGPSRFQADEINEIRVPGGKVDFGRPRPLLGVGHAYPMECANGWAVRGRNRWRILIALFANSGEERPTAIPLLFFSPHGHRRPRMSSSWIAAKARYSISAARRAPSPPGSTVDRRPHVGLLRREVRPRRREVERLRFAAAGNEDASCIPRHEQASGQHPVGMPQAVGYTAREQIRMACPYPRTADMPDLSIVGVVLRGADPAVSFAVGWGLVDRSGAERLILV